MRHIAANEFGKRGESRTSMTRHNEDSDKAFKRLGKCIAKMERMPIPGKRNPMVDGSGKAWQHPCEGKGSGQREQHGGASQVIGILALRTVTNFSPTAVSLKRRILEVPLASVRDRASTTGKHSHSVPGPVLAPVLTTCTRVPFRRGEH